MIDAKIRVTKKVKVGDYSLPFYAVSGSYWIRTSDPLLVRQML